MPRTDMKININGQMVVLPEGFDDYIDWSRAAIVELDTAAISIPSRTAPRRAPAAATSSTTSISSIRPAAISAFPLYTS